MQYDHQYGEETRFENEMFINPEFLPTKLNDEDEISKIIHDIKNRPDPYVNFIRGVIEALEMVGIDGNFDYDIISDKNDNSSERSKQKERLLEVLKNKYKSKYNGKIPSSFRSVKNWLEGNSRIDTNPGNGNNAHNRRKLYEFCMIMDMDLQHTADFFWKYFQTIPFNFKNRDDAIFFYCIKNNRDLYTVNYIYDRLERTETLKDTGNSETISVYKNIKSLNEEDFIEYLSKNNFDHNMFFYTAKKIIKNLCSNYIKEYELKSIYSMLDDIYGSKYTITTKGYKKKYPEWFKEVIISPMDLSAIIHFQNVSYEKIRKALIILNYYGFHKDYQKVHSTTNSSLIPAISKRRKEFRDNTNELLTKIGFEPLYPVSSFDWMILYLANQYDPLEVFKSLFTEALE